MIHVEELCFTRPGMNTPVINGLSFHLNAGEILLLCGRNGAGKSTLLRLLGGTLTPTSGKLSCAGLTWPENSTGTPRSALLLQEAEHQILGATVREDMLLPWPKPTDEQKAKATALAESCDLGHKLDADTAHLSYGQKRKLCIASALMTDPQVLLLDEPTCGLDYPACQRMGESIQKLREQGITFVISTHDPDLFLPLLDERDQILLLDDGKPFFLGPIKKGTELIRQHPELGIRPCGLL